MLDETDLARRTGLPDALRTLLRDYPRDLWEAHEHFDGLTRFWLERHLMFRTLLSRMRGATEDMVDRAADPDPTIRATGRYAQMLLTQLHGHHQIEDLHYFPQLAALEPRLARGFEILDHDHHALDGHLHRLADVTNRLLRAEPIRQRDRAAALHEALGAFDGFLDRHLVDEEDLIVPIILRHGAALEG